MRILWLSNAPWMATGYGRQTALFAPLLAGAGHDVAICAMAGLQGGPLTWQGIPVYPGGQVGAAMDVIAGHYAHHKADLLITLMDTWRLVPEAVAGLNVACWTPVDCEPMSCLDWAALTASGAKPVAMSRFGEAMMRKKDLAPLYVPHGVDTSVFRPCAGPGWSEARPAGRPFTVGMVAANTDKRRKGFDKAFQAFARYRDKHAPDARLLVHAQMVNDLTVGADGLDLAALAEARALGESVSFCDQYAYKAGLTGDDAMASFLSGLDVLLNPSLGEGFGLPVLEAQACGTPVIVTRGSAMAEMCGAGWSVTGEREWNWMHRADWTDPTVDGLVKALGRAHRASRSALGPGGQAVTFAGGYEAGRVMREYWAPALEILARR